VKYFQTHSTTPLQLKAPFQFSMTFSTATLGIIATN